MNSKKKKFYNIKKTFKLFNNKVESICLITHVNDLNTIQNNLLKVYCDANGIDTFSTKLNLLRKLTHNTYFINVFAGPTKLFFFNSFDSFSNFLEKHPLNEKIIPLCVYFNNNFFTFPIFVNKLKIFKQELNLSEVTFKSNFISLLNNKSVSFIKILSVNVTSFINFLSHIKYLKSK